MLDEQAKTDVSILGAGIAGLTLGVLCARGGLRTCVVDPGLRLGERDGLMAAVGSVQQELQYHHLSRFYGSPAAKRYRRECERGRDFVLAESARAGLSVERYPMATLTGDGLQAHWLRHEVKAMREVGLSPRFDDVSGLPFETRPQLILDEQFSLDALAYRDHLARAFAAAGGQVRRAPVRARREVSATQQPAFDRCGIGVRLVRATWHWLALEGAEQPSRISFLIDDGGRLLVPRGGRLLVGSRRDDAEDWVATRFPDALIAERWQARAVVSIDALPFAGYATLRPGPQLIVTGFDAWELLTGTAAALQVYAVIAADLRQTGERPDLPWAPLRVPRATTLGRALVSNARYTMRVSAVAPFPHRG